MCCVCVCVCMFVCVCRFVCVSVCECAVKWSCCKLHVCMYVIVCVPCCGLPTVLSVVFVCWSSCIFSVLKVFAILLGQHVWVWVQ